MVQKIKIDFILFLITTAVFVMVFISVFVWIIISINEERDSLRNQMALYKVKLLKDVRTSTTMALYRNTSDQRKELKDLSVNNSVVDTIKFIKEAGVASGADVTIDAVNPLGGKDIKSTIVSILVNGNFKEIFYLLSLLETMPGANEIEQFFIKQTGGEGVWRGSFRIKIFTSNYK